jgi:hypothetical protein
MKKKLNIYSLRTFEKLIILLGILGLFPFILGLIDLWFNYPSLYFLINIPKNYGVVILAFLGAIYWGMILNSRDKKNLSEKLKNLTVIWSIMPSLFGIIILTIENKLGLIILSLGFFCSHIIDEIYYKLLFFPKWYILLRRALTAVVIVILVSAYSIIS